MKINILKSFFVFALLQTALTANATDTVTPQAVDTVQFFMEVDTTMTQGIRVGQELRLSYMTNAPYQSIVTPQFGEGIELVKGPEPFKSSSTRTFDGVTTSMKLSCECFMVRFMKVGETALPVTTMEVDGKVYTTPPQTVMVRPALADTGQVKCSLQVEGEPQLGKRTMITLVCNRQPDKLKPVVMIDGVEVASGSMSASSVNGEVKYSFTYYVIFEHQEHYTISCRNLVFGGVEYEVEPLTISVGFELAVRDVMGAVFGQ